MKRYLLALTLGILMAPLVRGMEVEDRVVKELMAIGEFYMDKKAYGLASQWFKRLLEKYPTTSYLLEIKLKMANCLVGRGAFDEALSVYREIEETYPNTEYFRQALLGEIDTLRVLKRNDQLLKKLDTFLSCYPDSEEAPGFLFLKANILQERWEAHIDRKARDEAIKVYKQLILKFPQHPLAEKSFDKLASLWRDIERYDDKKELWKSIVYRILILWSYKAE